MLHVNAVYNCNHRYTQFCFLRVPRRKISAKRGVYLLRVSISVEEKWRKLRGKRTLKILVNSWRGKLSSEFCGKWGIRMECTVGIIWNMTNQSNIFRYLYIAKRYTRKRTENRRSRHITSICKHKSYKYTLWMLTFHSLWAVSKVIFQ